VVVEDKTPNAFVLPGGKIVVFTSAPPRAAQQLAAPVCMSGYRPCCGLSARSG